MWTSLYKTLSDQRFQALACAFVLATITQMLGLLSHKLGLDPDTAAKIPMFAHVLTGIIGAFTFAFVGAHAAAEHGQNVGNGIAQGLQAAGGVVQKAIAGGTVALPSDPNTPADAPAATPTAAAPMPGAPPGL